MHAPAPELKALRKLAEKYETQYQKLLAAEITEMGSAPVVDSAGKLWELNDKGVTLNGSKVTITRIDIKSKRIVVLHDTPNDDGSEHKQLLMGHRVTKTNKVKAGAAKAPAKAAAAAKPRKSTKKAAEPAAVETVQDEAPAASEPVMPEVISTA